MFYGLSRGFCRFLLVIPTKFVPYRDTGNLTTGNVTSYYYSGNKLVAEREGSTLRYFHQDSLSSTSLMTDASGGSLGTTKYYPLGAIREGSAQTDILFKGQRLDDTGLYYSGAGYYDSNIGTSINAHTHVKKPTNPQSLNSYTSTSPSKYIRGNAIGRRSARVAPALAVPVQTPPAQVQAEQVMAEPEPETAAATQPVTPEETPAAEQQPGQTPPNSNSNGYGFLRMNAVVVGKTNFLRGMVPSSRPDWWCGPASGVSIGAYYRQQYPKLPNNEDMYDDLYFFMGTFVPFWWNGWNHPTMPWDYGPGFRGMASKYGYSFSFEDHLITKSNYWIVVNAIDSGWPVALMLLNQQHWVAIKGYKWLYDYYAIDLTDSATNTERRLDWKSLGSGSFTIIKN